MASTIITKYSGTASAVPVSGDLTQGELAVNTADKRLFTKNGGGTVVELGTNPTSLTTGAISGTTLTASSTTTLSGGTANGVAYLNGSKVVTTGSALTFDGSKLTVKGGNAGQFVLDNGGQQYVQQIFQVNSTANSGADFLYDGTNSVFNIRTLAVAPIAFSVSASAGSPAEGMRLTSTGLGIGTSSPVNKLQISQTNSTTLNGGAYVNLGKTENGVGGYHLIGAGYNQGSNYAPSYFGFVETSNSGGTAGDLVWFTRPSGQADTVAPSERMRLDSSGNLLVGTTSQYGSGKVSIPYSSSAFGISMQSTTASAANYAIEFKNSSGSGVGAISASTTATTYATSSDYRLKHDIAPMTGALTKVAALKPVTYKWNADDSEGEGFIAHELAEVCPHAVTGEKDAVDEDGNPVYQGIDTSFLVATLTAAIQEQQVLITQLTERITALESK